MKPFTDHLVLSILAKLHLRRRRRRRKGESSLSEFAQGAVSLTQHLNEEEILVETTLSFSYSIHYRF